MAIAILTVIYDELGGHRDWMNRSTLLPVGYAFFEIGVCLDFDFALGVLVAFGAGVGADVGEEGTIHDVVEA